MRPTAMIELSSVLSEIATRRWSDARRPMIAMQADAEVPAQLIAQVIGALRATADGKVLFPDVALSS
jgi:hypothetical protein